MNISYFIKTREGNMGIGLEFDEVLKYIFILPALYVAGSVILRYMHIPARIIAVILSNSLMGLGMMILINALTVNSGFTLPVNPFNVIFSAVFGIPGVLCLLAISIIL